LREIRLHGRGGQGVVTAAEILATAYVMEGKYACSFPLFGIERRGAPLASFVRKDDSYIREKTRVYTPDYVLILDSALKNSPDTIEGLKEEGIVLINTIRKNPPAHMLHRVKNLAIIDATHIALKEIGRPITNSCMLGAFASVTKEVKLESLQCAFAEYFSGSLLEKNLSSCSRGYSAVKMLE
jgi:2-oxoacid:acceptor oxidoreductase gamma subunit (pyruvate/2-ketoisovalerate family)